MKDIPKKTKERFRCIVAMPFSCIAKCKKMQPVDILFDDPDAEPRGYDRHDAAVGEMVKFCFSEGATKLAVSLHIDAWGWD